MALREVRTRSAAALLLLLAGCSLPSPSLSIGTGTATGLAGNAANTQIPDGTSLTATLAGAAGDNSGKDVGGQGTVTITKNGDTITLQLQVSNLAGPMPPFQSFIRIGAGAFNDRIVLGTLDGASWENLGSNTYRLNTFWSESEIFPRIPGFTLSEIFEYLTQEPGSFFFNVVTNSFPKGAIKGFLQAA